MYYIVYLIYTYILQPDPCKTPCTRAKALQLFFRTIYYYVELTCFCRSVFSLNYY